MVKGALGVLGASALLAIGCAQAFALDPVPSVPVPTVSVPSVTVPVPTVSVPTVTSPTATVSVPTATSPTATVSVPTVTSPTSTVTGATASSPSTPVSAPSASLPGSSTSSGSSGSSSGTGGSASGSSDQQSSQGGGDGTRSARPAVRNGPPLRGTPAQVSKPREEPARDDAGRLALERLDRWLSPSFRSPPTAAGSGDSPVQAHRERTGSASPAESTGMPLSAGTYRIRVAAVKGQKVTSVRRETVVVVAPGQSIRVRARAEINLRSGRRGCRGPR